MSYPFQPPAAARCSVPCNTVEDFRATRITARLGLLYLRKGKITVEGYWVPLVYILEAVKASQPFSEVIFDPQARPPSTVAVMACLELPSTAGSTAQKSNAI